MAIDRGTAGCGVPVEPPRTGVVFPPAREADEHGVVCSGTDLEPGTILAAYREGLFPFRLEVGGPVHWFCPDPRAILEHRSLAMVRTARAAARRHGWTVAVDRGFEEVVRRCADRDEVWIDEQLVTAYGNLARLGWAHSIEVWQGDELVGGLYGVLIGRLWFGESMFTIAPNASKYALAWLVDRLVERGADFQDVQFLSPHMARLGATEIPRDEFLTRLAVAVAAPQIDLAGDD